MSNSSQPARASDCDAETDAVFSTADAHRAQVARVRPLNKAALFSALAAARITHVSVSFDGCGDSGQVESIEAKANTKSITLPDAHVGLLCPLWGNDAPEQRRVPLAMAIEDIAYDCLAQVHDGWQDGDGAFGEFLFDVAAATIRLDYNQRFTDHTSHSHSF